MNCDIKEALFNNLELNKMEFLKTKLADVDFSTCNIYGAIFDFYSLKGIIIEPYQSEALVGMLGVQFKN